MRIKYQQSFTTFNVFKVKAMNFFDIVIDFILFDAFDDLESPPSSVTSVVQNRWLSNGFKETVNKSSCGDFLFQKKQEQGAF